MTTHASTGNFSTCEVASALPMTWAFYEELADLCGRYDSTDLSSPLCLLDNSHLHLDICWLILMVTVIING